MAPFTVCPTTKGRRWALRSRRLSLCLNTGKIRDEDGWSVLSCERLCRHRAGGSFVASVRAQLSRGRLGRGACDVGDPAPASYGPDAGRAVGDAAADWGGPRVR